MYTSELTHVVVIPDAHGDALALLRSLWLAVVRIDENPDLTFHKFVAAFDAAIAGRRWQRVNSLSTTQSVGLVQLGDLVDRGPYSLRCISIMEVAGSVLGWSVITLYGNHEMMSILGTNSKYVHPRESIVAGGSVAARNAMFAIGQPLHTRMTSQMVGLARLSIGPSGRWIPDHHERSPATLFVHGGIDLEWMARMAEDGDVNAVNGRLYAAAFTVPSLWDWNRPRSPFWIRDYEFATDSNLCGYDLSRVLRKFKVGRIVVGHMPQEGGVVRSRCQGRIILTDVKMSRWMDTRDVDEGTSEGGRPVAVIMRMDADGFLESVAAHYTDLKTGTEVESTVILPFGGNGGEQTAEDGFRPVKWFVSGLVVAALVAYGLSSWP